MKNVHTTIARAVAATLLVCSAGMVSAAGSTSVTVTATVTAACKFTATTMSAIALGSIDPATVSANVTNTGNITYQCTKGTTPSVTLASGTTARSLTLASHTAIPYTFTLGSPDAGTGFSVAGSAKVVATATIAKTDAQDAEAGVGYSDVVTLDINN
jgi:spore coat protein U-like protein